MIGKLRKAIERRLSAQDILSYAAITQNNNQHILFLLPKWSNLLFIMTYYHIIFYPSQYPQVDPLKALDSW